jgi:hypothetical protein
MCTPKVIGIGFMCALVFSLNAEAKLCKWVGPDGKVRYGEVTSDKAAAQDNCTEVVSSDASRASKQETVTEDREKSRRANALRSSYSNEKEIDLAFERNAALVNARIDAYDVQLKSAQDTLTDLNKYMGDRKREGKAIPQSAYDDIAATEERVARLASERAKVEEELRALKTRCEEDKVLFRKISVLSPVDDAKTVDHSYPYADGAGGYSYPCCTGSKRARKARSSWQY